MSKRGASEVRQLFTLGYLPLEQRALAESLYWRVSASSSDGVAAQPGNLAPGIVELEALLTDCICATSRCSIRCSITGRSGSCSRSCRCTGSTSGRERRAVLVDLTCDSDGKVTEYVSSLETASLAAASYRRSGTPYYLGFFLVGAYQDILGDAHNLFGRLPEAHVYADDEEPGNFWIEKIIHGTSVQEMLAQVQYFPNDLNRRMSELVRAKIHRTSCAQRGHGDPRRVHDVLQARRPIAQPRHRAGKLQPMTARALGTPRGARSRSGSCRWRWPKRPTPNLAKAIDGVREAAKRGAQLVVSAGAVPLAVLLPERGRGAFCARRSGARPDHGDAGKLAAELDITLVASLFEQRAAGLYHNTAAVLDAERGYLGKYRKMHIPDDPRYYEKFYFTPGDLGFKVFQTQAGRARRAGVLGPVVSRSGAPHGACRSPRCCSIRRRSAGIRRRRRSTASASTARGKRCNAGTRRERLLRDAVNRTGFEPDPRRRWRHPLLGPEFHRWPDGRILVRAPVDREVVIVEEIDLAEIDAVAPAGRSSATGASMPIRRSRSGSATTEAAGPRHCFHSEAC